VHTIGGLVPGETLRERNRAGVGCIADSVLGGKEKCDEPKID